MVPRSGNDALRGGDLVGDAMKVRTLHLCAGLFLLAPMLVYFASSVQLAHRSWWPVTRVIKKSTVGVSSVKDGRAIARELMDRGLVRGEIRQILQSSGSLTISLRNPGTSYSVKCMADSCEIQKTTAGFAGLLTSLHSWSGLNAWGGVLIVVSLGLLLLGITGIWMALTNPRERRTNAILLVLSMSCALYLLISMRL